MRIKKLCNIEVEENLGEDSLKNFVFITKNKPKSIEDLKKEGYISE